MKSNKMILAVLFVAMVFLTVGAAHDSYAALETLSPAVDPNHGFPVWYQDTDGLQLQPCLDPVNCGLVAEVGIFDPANPVNFPGNFPSAFFYYDATARMNVGNPATLITLVLAVEGAFTNAVPEAGAQETLTRIQVESISDLVPGANYVIDHPYGTINATADATGTIARVRDELGCVATPPLGGCGFSIALGIGAAFPTVGPFLKQLAPPPPAGFVGDGGLVGDVTITPGPNGDFFRVTGPNAGGLGVNTAQTNLWTITGQIFGTVPRFRDVTAAHPFFTHVNSIAAAGITGGCSTNPPNFCPDQTLTRAQMAVFMEASLGVAAPPACSGTLFTDVSPLTVGQTVCDFIEDFANRGITGGCGGGRFCPNDPVTRGQMAVFVEAALGVTAAPACIGNRFGDVSEASQGAAFCGFIEDFALKGITGGCQAGPPAQFCPNDPVTRGQMAVFIVAAPTPLLP
jgi:hypothetical protein